MLHSCIVVFGMDFYQILQKVVLKWDSKKVLYNKMSFKMNTKGLLSSKNLF